MTTQIEQSTDQLKDQSTDQSTEIITVQTFRFKFSQELTEHMSHFAKIHQYDERKDFKESWQEWIKDADISALINEENKKLYHQGYEGDIMEKMFKSIRYYYRVKSDNKTPTVPRKEYISFTQNMLDIMDSHIKVKFLENTTKNKDNQIITKISPANAYTEFCNTHHAEIEKETQCIYEQYEDKSEINNKFKKTYKNRYFIQSKIINGYIL